MLQSIVRAATRRPSLVVAGLVALAIVGGVLALGLQTDASTQTIVGDSSPAARANDREHQQFGDDAIDVLVRQPLRYTVLTADLARVTQLEACMAGNIPAGKSPYGPRGGPCWQFAASHPAQVVYGPGTFLFEAVNQLTAEFTQQEQASQRDAQTKALAAMRVAAGEGRSRAQQLRIGRQVEQLVGAQFLQSLYTAATRYGISTIPSLGDPQFLSEIVFDPNRPPGCPKARFAFLFPSCNDALIQVRLRPSLSSAQRTRAIALVRAAVKIPDFALHGGGSYLVSGAPVLISDLSTSLTGSLGRLLLVALAVMAIVLACVFRTRARLLPLAVALAATGITFGAMRLVGAHLTMASVAVLPILIGLAVDYAIQFQSRWDEARASGAEPTQAALRAAALGGPAIATAGAATALGFLVLLASPIPMVRSFGLELVVGVAIALGCALTGGFATLVLHARRAEGRERRSGREGRERRGAAGGGIGGAVGGAIGGVLRRGRDLFVGSLLGARELLRDAAAALRLDVASRRVGVVTVEVARRARRAPELAIGQPGRVLAVAALLAVLGWGLGTSTTVNSDLQRLVPSGLPAVHDLETLEHATNAAGEVDVYVEGADVTTPAAVSWMRDYQAAVLKRVGYSESAGCQSDELCPALSLTDLFTTDTTSTNAAQLQAILAAVPPYFAQAVLTPDHRQAVLAFGIRLESLGRQQRLFDAMRAMLHPPPGIRATLTGLPVLTAQANADLSSQTNRALTLLLALAAVALVLIAVLRSVERALLPLIPIALATGWSSLVLFVLNVELNPMSVGLGVLVIAITTEFSVLLSSRYREERESGADTVGALRRTYSSTGAAVLASATTAIAGFAVLISSDINMLRSFGIVAVVDLAVALAGVMVVLPAVLLLAEQGALRDLPARLRQRARGLAVRPRRAPAA